MNATLLSFALSASLLTSPAYAAAQSNSVTLKGDVRLEKTIVENGVSRIVVSEPKVVIPGDHLVFSTTYNNEGTLPVTNFVVTNPLPAAVTLSSESLGAAQVSVDGGKTWGSLSALTVDGDNDVRRPAMAADVTHMRWVIARISAGASGTVEYHATVR